MSLSPQEIELREAVGRFNASSPNRGVGCWLWTAGTNDSGYGQFRFRGRVVKAHRFAYEAFRGPCAGLEIHHACLNTLCVRPDHLEAMTRAEHRVKTRLLALDGSA